MPAPNFMRHAGRDSFVLSLNTAPTGAGMADYYLLSGRVKQSIVIVPSHSVMTKLKTKTHTR